MKQSHTSHPYHRIQACLVAMLCLLTLLGASISQTISASAKETTLTGQSAKDLTGQMTIGWNLGNTLDAHGGSSTAAPEKYVTTWGNPAPTQATFDAIKKAGFNTVRIPTTWYPHVTFDTTSQTYVVDETWMNYVKQVVDFAYQQDMFVILNVHHEDTWINVSQFTDETLETAKKMLSDIWTQIATTFQDYDQHLVFEGMNEPRQKANSAVGEWGNGSGDNGYTWSYINALNAVFVQTVRSQGSSANQERLLMLPGYCASSDPVAINQITVPENAGNVALSVHAYAPYFFTMDTSNYANHSFPGKSGWGEDYETNLTNLFQSLKSISDSKQVPIIIGEFSASDFENTADREHWATSYLTHAKEAGIPCVLWDNNVPANGTGEAHGYLYRLTNTWYPNSISVIRAMMAVYDITPELPEYEEYVAPTFSWDDMQIGEDWVELYKKEAGKSLAAWKNAMVLTDWKTYLKPGAKFVMFADATSDPELVLQGGWYRLASSGSTGTFVYEFSYESIVEALEAEGANLDDMQNLYVSATAQAAKIYGLYAVPAKSSSETVLGDLNGDGELTLLDAVLMQRFLLGDLTLTNEQAAVMDCNEDGVWNAFDGAYLKRKLLLPMAEVVQ